MFDRNVIAGASISRTDASADESRGRRRLLEASPSRRLHAFAEIHASAMQHAEIDVVLTPQDRARLQRVVRSRLVPVRQHVRSRIVLMAGEGLPNAEIARRLQIDKRTVRLWRERFAQEGLDALQRDAPRRGRPSRLGDDARGVARRLRDEGWRLDDIAHRLAVSVATVSRLVARRRDL